MKRDPMVFSHKTHGAIQAWVQYPIEYRRQERPLIEASAMLTLPSDAVPTEGTL